MTAGIDPANHGKPMAGRQEAPGIPHVSTANARRYNLRDYGGYACRSGGRIATGRLFRSGELDHADAEDQGLVERLKIDWVIDFRGHSEVSATPPPAFAGFGGQIFFASEPDNTIPHAIAQFGSLAGPVEAVAHFCGIYRKLPESGRFVVSMKGYLQALALADNATLVHCFAGKDRTGLAVALLHTILGVHADDRMADYLLTNDMGEERIEVGARSLRRQTPDGTPEWAIREAMGVRPEFLNAAFDEIEGRYGSVEGYLERRIGAEAPLLQKIVARYCA